MILRNGRFSLDETSTQKEADLTLLLYKSSLSSWIRKLLPSNAVIREGSKNEPLKLKNMEQSLMRMDI